MSEKPTLVFVPGAWHLPECWHKIVSAMEAQDFKCVPVALPTVSSNTEATFGDDVHAIQDSIKAETTQGRNVVVVVHSYGGAVGASALKGFTAKPKDEGTGRVIGFFMIATGFAVGGVTFLDVLGGKPPPIWEANYETGLAPLTVDPRELFYHDLPEEEGKYWVDKLQPQSLKAFTTGAEYGYPGWKEVPVWYLATTEDRSHPTEVQKMFTQKARDEGGDIEYREIASSHSPFLSKPDETSAILLEAIQAFTA
ncbi:AB hydrolase-1 domain-containing protein [Fusarium sp. LHS14.1]|nr:AB hydrolase-1 domain-containing protein [Fusarium sp. LHS14.1]